MTIVKQIFSGGRRSTQLRLFVFLAIFFFSSAQSLSNQGFIRGGQEFKRSDFPDGFLFGTATSAYQIEGAYLEDGKSLSNWDVFCRVKGHIKNDENGEIADDHYHRYMEDIEIMHSMGVNTYRFSISWSRVLPRGKLGEVNAAGIMFYNKILDNLLLRGIEPFVTIYHQDFPQEFEDRYGSWLSPLMQQNFGEPLPSEEFVHFSETCFKNFGDRVKYWITINEPNLNAEMCYERGWYPPGHCSPPFGNCSIGNSDVEPLVAMHNMLLAHAKATRLYRQQYKPKQGGSIGIVAHMFMFRPLTDNELGRKAASRGMAFNVGWTFDPLVFGDYPSEMRRYLGSELPHFSQEEKEYIKGSIDFIGINHYSAIYAKDCIHSSCSGGADHAIRGFVYITGERDGILIGERTGMARFFVVPQGMEEIIEYIKQRYNNMPMFITENGYSPPEQGLESQDLLHDDKRVAFHRTYLASVLRAIRNGADVRGYFVWSLMDNFEWTNGLSVTFGLHHIDPATLNRIPKLSAKWYQNFLTNRSSSSS